MNMLKRENGKKGKNEQKKYLETINEKIIIINCWCVLLLSVFISMHACKNEGVGACLWMLQVQASIISWKN